MLMVKKMNRGIPIIDCWYATEVCKEKGIIRYKEAYFNSDKKYEQFHTLISDLSFEKESIEASYSKNCRYEVRRAEREGINCLLKCGTEITRTEIDEFCDFFVDFWKSKDVDYTEIEKLRNEISWYAEQNAFAITKAMLGDKVLVYHTYVVDSEAVRLYHSASTFRVDETIPQSLVGMANRYLHNQDMLTFKYLGKAKYDWGGAGKEKEVESITKFKESFGGEPAELYNFQEANGLKAKLYQLVVGILQLVTN